MKIGVVGVGIVGRGVLEVLRNNRDFTVKAICSRSKKDYLGAEYTQDFRKIAENPEIEIVVETIGGVGVAKELVELSLKNRKHVVTANKYLIAHHGRELFKLAEKMGVSIFYEAGVAGGVPVLSPLKETLSHARVTSVAGILNGTCNYILTKMRDEKLDFEEAVKKAQEAGYAEADPTFDIEGIDTSHKTALLTLLAYDRFVDAEGFDVKGIKDITYDDIRVAEKLGYSIKLIAESRNIENEEFSLTVQPMLV
ncbi:MAG: homoserine dehydrogenase, partial [Fusobacteriaceae bacterium]